MRLMFIGDVVGAVGCNFLASKIKTLRARYRADILVVNGENSASGNGITNVSANMLTRLGADVITTGNHAFKRHEAQTIFDSVPHLIRPANFPDEVYGRGVYVLDMGRARIAVVNMLGVAFLEPLANPFFKIDSIVESLDTPNIFLDFHAEATAEKKAMGFYLDGRVTAVIGTHTHVQTADERILPKGTAYITDAGMTGPENSILGVDIDAATVKMKLHIPTRFTEAQSPCFINGVVVDFNEKTGRSNSIERICIR